MHSHSCYSKRDAHARVDKLVSKAKELGQEYVTVTDHGVLHAIPQLFAEAKKQGIKPIAGFEGYIAPQGRDKKGEHFHQLLIALNDEGFKNLMKLSSEGFMSGFYNRPRFDFELLERYSGGIVATSSCLAGMIPQAILNGDLKEARKIARRFQDILGDKFFLEIQPTPTTQQDVVNRELIKISQELSIPLLATCDTHFVEKDDKIAHMGMLALGRGKKMRDAPQYDGEENYYMKGAKEVYTDFRALGYDQSVIIEAMNNTYEIAKLVDFDLKKEGDHLPAFPLPEGYTDNDKLIGDMVKEGLMRKVPIKTKAYIERIQFELSVIREKGYQDYFLIVSDAIKYCKENNIMVNFGRGSGAGSLVAYLLDITEVDPIIHDLYFERFLDITRKKMPDIDTDIEDEGRQDVIRYLKGKYGYDKVSQVVNYGKMSAKLAFKNALMVFDVPFGESQEITNLVPDGVTIQEAYELSPELKKLRKKTTKDKETGAPVKLDEVFDLAERFEGVIDKFGTHAGGILITPEPISDHFPVFGTPEQMVTQWDKDDIEHLGGVKFDFLGLKTLRTVSLCLKSIESETGEYIDIFKIGREANDPATYARIARGDTANTFQFNSEGMQQLCKAVKPTEFKHIVAINALYRPPALASGDTWKYARIKNGEEAEYYTHPDEKLVTGETYGIITYQEHVMRLVHQFAGWSYGKGDSLRKKKTEELEAMRVDFINDSLVNYGYDQDNTEFAKQMDEIWTKIVRYMGYGFNKSHGVSYSMLSYVTAWLEEHYPEHWQASLMTVKMGDADKIAQLYQDVKSAGFEVVTPDVNRSSNIFVAHNGKIVFPLNAVKGVGDKAVDILLEQRPFSSLEELMEKCDLRLVSKRAMQPLIFAGAFDSLYPELTRKEIFVKYLTLKKDGKKNITKAQEMDWSDEIQAEHEKDLLGVYVTTHPMARYHFRDWREYTDGQYDCLVGGKLTKVKSFNDKRGNRMAFITMETLEGVREGVVFSQTFSKAEKLLKKGNMLMLTGKKDNEKIIVNKVKELV